MVSRLFLFSLSSSFHFKTAYSKLPNKHGVQIIVYSWLSNKHVRLFFYRKFFGLWALIWYCAVIDFQTFKPLSRFLIDPISIMYLHVAVNFRARKLLQSLWQKYEAVSRFLIDPISITYMLQLTFGLEKCYKFYGKCKIFSNGCIHDFQI